MWLQQKLTIVETASHSILCFIFGDSDENITWNVMDCMCKVQGASCLVSEKTKKRHQLSKRSKTFQKKMWMKIICSLLVICFSLGSEPNITVNLNITKSKCYINTEHFQTKIGRSHLLLSTRRDDWCGVCRCLMFGGLCRVENKVYSCPSCPLATTNTCRVLVRRISRLEGTCHNNGICSRKGISIFNHPDCWLKLKFIIIFIYILWKSFI